MARCKAKCVSHLIMSDSLWRQGLQPARLLCAWTWNIGVGCRSLLQTIFLTQGSNWGLLKYRQILYRLSHLGRPGAWESWTNLLWEYISNLSPPELYSNKLLAVGHIPKGGFLLESFKTWQQTKPSKTRSWGQSRKPKHPLGTDFTVRSTRVQCQARRNVPVGDTKLVPQDKPQESGPYSTEFAKDHPHQMCHLALKPRKTSEAGKINATGHLQKKNGRVIICTKH